MSRIVIWDSWNLSVDGWPIKDDNSADLNDQISRYLLRDG